MRFSGQHFQNGLAVLFGLIVFELGMHSERYVVPNEWLAIAIYALLYSATLLLAYRLRDGVYAGLGQVAVVATYISLGGTATVTAALSGALIAEAGRAVLYKSLNVPRLSLERGIATAFFTAGTGALAVIIGGAIYTRIGGMIPACDGQYERCHSAERFICAVVFASSGVHFRHISNSPSARAQAYLL